MAQLLDHIRQAIEHGTLLLVGGIKSATRDRTTDSTSLSPTSNVGYTVPLFSQTFLHNLLVVVSCVMFYKSLIELACFIRIRHHEYDMANFVEHLAPFVEGNVVDDVQHNPSSSAHDNGLVLQSLSSTATLRSSNSSSSRRRRRGAGAAAVGAGGRMIGRTSKVLIDHYTRSMLHIGLSSTVMFWPYLDQSDGWSWKLVALLPAVVMARHFYNAVIVRDTQDIDVQNYSVTNSPTDLLLGPTFHAGVMVWLSLRHFMTTEAAIIAAATLGDGIAPIVGEKFGRHIYRFPWTKRLTIEGSVVGVLLGTVVGCYYYMYMMGLPLLPLRMILTYGTIATVAESSSIAVMDNIIVPVMLHLCIDPVQMWL